MIKSHMVQKVSITPVAKELEQWLDIIQTKWHCKVLNVFETEGYDIPNGSRQSFIILYDDGKPIEGEGGLMDKDKLKAEIIKACMDEHFMPVKLLSCDDITDIIDKFWEQESEINTDGHKGYNT